MSNPYPNIINEIFFAKEKCAVCSEEFDSILLQHPPFDEAHKEFAAKRKEERRILEANRKPWDQLTDPLNRMISKECPDIKAARLFAYKWFTGTHEYSKEEQSICFPDNIWLNGTMRAIAYTISRVLEGYDDNTNVWLTCNYLTTTYGSDLYNAMCGVEIK